MPNYCTEEKENDDDYENDHDEVAEYDSEPCCGRCMNCLGLSWRDFL
jgi:hypothetical protein